MPASPTFSTTSSFSSTSSTCSSPDYTKRFISTSNSKSSAMFKLARPTHKRAISDFSNQQHHQKIRKTTHRNKNILLWPSQLHSLDMASQEAKRGSNTPSMSRQASAQSNVSVQENPVLLGYMELLQKQQQRDLAKIPSLSRSASRQPSLGA